MRLMMKKLPDLERLVSRVRARRCSLKDFHTLLQGFRLSVDIIHSLQKELDSSVNSPKLVRELIESFPKLNDHLSLFECGIDWSRASTDGIIIPSPGIDEEYDRVLNQKTDIEKKLDDFLSDIRLQLKYLIFLTFLLVIGVAIFFTKTLGKSFSSWKCRKTSMFRQIL